MNVKEVIKQVAVLLQLQNVIDANLDDFENLDIQTKKDINLLISSANEVLSDIATEYLPLVSTEKITVKNGKFDLQTLSKQFYKMVDFSNGAYYKKDLDELFANDGDYNITYKYLPSELTIENPEINFDERLTVYALSYGVAREYCMILGNYSESEMWDSKFKNAMQVATRKKDIVKLKIKRWCWWK